MKEPLKNQVGGPQAFLLTFQEKSVSLLMIDAVSWQFLASVFPGLPTHVCQIHSRVIQSHKPETRGIKPAQWPQSPSAGPELTGEPGASPPFSLGRYYLWPRLWPHSVLHPSQKVFTPMEPAESSALSLSDATKSWFPCAAWARFQGISSKRLDVVGNCYNTDFQKEILKLYI